MDTAINITIGNYIKLIREKYTDIETAYLFGSFATGMSSQDSDIDLALIFKNLDDSKRFDIQVQLMILLMEVFRR